MRKAAITRKTNETEIRAVINLDGTGLYAIETQIPFFSHMLETFSRHSACDLTLSAVGDIEVDQHHLIEDIGIVLGSAIKKGLGNMKGINRAGFFVFPMDEALGVVALDICGRPVLDYKAGFRRRFCGGFDTDTLSDFFQGFSQGLGASAAVRTITGRSDHHKMESLFKALAKALKLAVSVDERLKEYLPTTKGVIA